MIKKNIVTFPFGVNTLNTMNKKIFNILSLRKSVELSHFLSTTKPFSEAHNIIDCFRAKHIKSV